MSALADFRKIKDDFFRTDPHSPLSRAQQKTFKGLDYFPENPELRYELSLQKTGKAEQVVMATSKCL